MLLRQPASEFPTLLRTLLEVKGFKMTRDDALPVESTSYLTK